MHSIKNYFLSVYLLAKIFKDMEQNALAYRHILQTPVSLVLVRLTSTGGRHPYWLRRRPKTALRRSTELVRANHRLDVITR